MTIFKTQTVDLFISHSQIVLCDELTYDDNRFNWGDLNVEQGAVLHPDCLTFTPIPDRDFEAPVYLSIVDRFARFELDKQAKRAIVAPFCINNPDHLEIASVVDHFKVELSLKRSLYHVYFELCGNYTQEIGYEREVEEEDNLFIKLTLIENAKIIRPHYLLDDEWGAKKDKELVIGKADKPFTMKIGRMQRYLRSLGISISKSSQIFTDLSEENRSQIKRSIGWHPVGGCHCIAYDFEPGEGWSVFYAERGGCYDIQTFANEADACYAFIYLVS